MPAVWSTRSTLLKSTCWVCVQWLSELSWKGREKHRFWVKWQLVLFISISGVTNSGRLLLSWWGRKGFLLSVVSKLRDLEINVKNSDFWSRDLVVSFKYTVVFKIASLRTKENTTGYKM